METKSFYGTRRSRYGRLTSYILSPNVPDDGNISDVDGDSSKDGDAIDTQAVSYTHLTLPTIYSV